MVTVHKKSEVKRMENKLISVKTAAGIAIGAVLMFVLNRFAAVSIGVSNTSLQLGIAILAAFAAVFGPVAGFLIGFIGHTLTDLSWGGVWWSWVISSAFFGLAIGAFRKYYNAENGGFGIKQCFIFNGVQIVANIAAWVFFARTLDLIIYQEPFERVSLQSFVAAGVNIAVVMVLGSLILFCYSKIQARNTRQLKPQNVGFWLHLYLLLFLGLRGALFSVRIGTIYRSISAISFSDISFCLLFSSSITSRINCSLNKPIAMFSFMRTPYRYFLLFAFFSARLSAAAIRSWIILNASACAQKSCFT